MALQPTPYIWMDGEFVEWDKATVHVLTHALHYGSAVFEGIRAYNTPKGPAIFRGKDHMNRLIDSALIYQMAGHYDPTTLLDVTLELLSRNNISSCYIRPLLYRGYGTMGLFPGHNPVKCMIAMWEWGNYLGEASLENGIRCKMSSWTRIDTRMLPPLSKSAANYANAALAKVEAVECGYDEAILLNLNGTVAEGPAENIFVIKNGVMYTPPVSDGALAGITRDAVMVLAQDMGISVVEKSILRDELFVADELFFTGTAVEVTPIREIDGRIIKSNGRGPITQRIQSAYFDVVYGKNERYAHWLDLKI